MAIALLASGMLPQAASAAKRPDLVVTALSAKPVSITAGASTKATFTVKNVGVARAIASKTGVLLSKNQKYDKGDRLLGTKATSALPASRKATLKLTVVIPAATTAGAWKLLACADVKKKVAESKEGNNCKWLSITVVSNASTSGTPTPTPTPVDPRTVDGDLDGVTEANGDCAPADPTRFPGAADKPDMLFVDTNCDGIDGDKAKAIFVATTGSDLNAGTQAAPKKTIAAAEADGANAGKELYVAAGTYNSATTLVLYGGISIYGGYAADWSRSLVNVTAFTSDDGTVAKSTGLLAGDTLQMLRFSARNGVHHIALNLSNSTVKLEQVSLLVAQGFAVVGNASVGDPGGQGTSGNSGQPGSCASNAGGFGGLLVGGDFDQSGSGGRGGTGGDGATASLGRGANGSPSQEGTLGGDGAYFDWPAQAGITGTSGGPGGNGSPASQTFGVTFQTTDGQMGGNGGKGKSGGGGGGGYGATNRRGGGGGSGGVGSTGGGGGYGGATGGSSIGLYLSNSSVTLVDSFVSAGNGGNGQGGGAGGIGGVQSSGGPGGVAAGCTVANGYRPGAAGGRGGAGGNGGYGAPGRGGNSYGIVRRAGSTSTLQGTSSIAIGTPGAGGTTPGFATAPGGEAVTVKTV